MTILELPSRQVIEAMDKLHQPMLSLEEEIALLTEAIESDPRQAILLGIQIEINKAEKKLREKADKGTIFIGRYNEHGIADKYAISPQYRDILADIQDALEPVNQKLERKDGERKLAYGTLDCMDKHTQEMAIMMMCYRMRHCFQEIYRKISVKDRAHFSEMEQEIFDRNMTIDMIFNGRGMAKAVQLLSLPFIPSFYYISEPHIQVMPD